MKGWPKLKKVLSVGLLLILLLSACSQASDSASQGQTSTQDSQQSEQMSDNAADKTEDDASNEATSDQQDSDDQTADTEDADSNKDDEDDGKKDQQDKDDDDSQPVDEPIKHFKGYAILAKKLPLQKVTADVVSDHEGARIILFFSKKQQHDAEYKSIYIKHDNRLKIIQLGEEGMIYNAVLDA